MNYYEELGVARDAPVEEIHLAYKNLVRLLHPDQQADEGLRRVAEQQMRRVNAIREVLTDPARRRLYDAALDRAAAPLARYCRRPFGSREASMLLAGAAIASFLWFAGKPQEGFSIRPPPRAAASRTAPELPLTASVPAPQPPKRIAPGRREAEVVAPYNPAAEPASAPHPSEAPRDDEEVDPPAPAAVAPITSPLLPQPPAQAGRPSPRFSGAWLYVRPRVPERDATVYPAEYVEAFIVESGDRLRGRYRARFRIPDRPISPEVVFLFEGRSQQDRAHLEWTGAGGARGEAELRLTSEQTMEFNWVATELGTQMGLGSGSAILTRRQER